MVFYIEVRHTSNSNIVFCSDIFLFKACESGSMFDHRLPSDWNVYATTASNDTVSSYACYWDPKQNVYLGDVYSVKWMEVNTALDDQNRTEVLYCIKYIICTPTGL